MSDTVTSNEDRFTEGPYGSCWAMDNVLVINTAHAPTRLVDNFDPVDPSNWLFFPGANIQVHVLALYVL